MWLHAKGHGTSHASPIVHVLKMHNVFLPAWTVVAATGLTSSQRLCTLVHSHTVLSNAAAATARAPAALLPFAPFHRLNQ
jgi:hypothetical protein